MLLDNVVSAQQQRLRDRQAEGLRGSHIDDQLELGRLLDGQVAGLRAPEDLIHVGGEASEQISDASLGEDLQTRLVRQTRDVSARAGETSDES